MKTPKGHYKITYDGESLWMDGYKKRNPDKAIIRAIEEKAGKVTKANQVEGSVDVWEDGEIDFWMKVD